MDNKWLYTTPIAHRGLHTNNVPENSLIAFKAALEEGYAIELDVQLSKDDQIVVFHDYSLKRMCNLDKKVNELDYKELKKLKLNQTNERIPLLKDVLKLVDGKIPLLIEIKNEKRVGKLEDNVCDLLKDYNGEFAIEAFNPFVLIYIKKTNPQIIRGQLSSSFKNEKMSFIKKLILRNCLLNFLSKPNFIAYNIHDLPNTIASIHKKKIPIIAWTIKSNKDIKNKKKYYDNIIFEKIKPKSQKL